MNTALVAMVKALLGDNLDTVIKTVEDMKKAADEMVAMQKRIENRLAQIEQILARLDNDRCIDGQPRCDPAQGELDVAARIGDGTRQ